MLTVLRLELNKLLARRGTYAGLVVLAVLVGLFVWGTKVHGPPVSQHIPMSGEFVLGGKILTAPMMAYIMLAVPVAIAVLIPLLVATTAGGLVAAEARDGTLRYLLTRPVSRLAVLGGKLLAGWAHAMGLTLLMGVLAVAAGYAVFGGGDLLVCEPTLAIFPESKALLHLLAAYLLAGTAMCAVASIALLLSVICDNPLTAAGITVAFLLVCAALEVIPYFEWLQPHLLTAHLQLYKHVLTSTLPVEKLVRSLAYVGAYATVPFILAAYIFHRKDIVC